MTFEEGMKHSKRCGQCYWYDGYGCHLEGLAGNHQRHISSDKKACGSFKKR